MMGSPPKPALIWSDGAAQREASELDPTGITKRACGGLVSDQARQSRCGGRTVGSYIKLVSPAQLALEAHSQWKIARVRRQQRSERHLDQGSLELNAICKNRKQILQAVAEHSLYVSVDTVPNKSNFADGHSRGWRLPMSF